jgi:hypothetical protein
MRPTRATATRSADRRWRVPLVGARRIDITVPDDWRVTIDGPAIFGGFENRAVVADPEAPTLKIRALAVLGGVDVKTAPRPADAAGPRSRLT